MVRIFVNLKRFDVPRRLGGLCPVDRPDSWITDVIGRSAESGIAGRNDVDLVYLLPESLILPAVDAAERLPASSRSSLSVGSQGVFREDVRPGGNFGAFTTNLPAAAAANLGARWAIIGHSEERKDKLGVISAYDSASQDDTDRRTAALRAVDRLVNQEAHRCLEAGLSLLFCIGETEDERGGGSFDEQRPRVEAALHAQIETGLSGLKELLADGEDLQLVIGYEPIWAIGPGKTPPGDEYIDFVASFIKKTSQHLYGMTPPVVYGGGLKAANAAEIGGVASVDGGLVALTRFTKPLAFEPADLVEIVELYVDAQGDTE